MVKYTIIGVATLMQLYFSICSSEKNDFLFPKPRDHLTSKNNRNNIHSSKFLFMKNNFTSTPFTSSYPDIDISYHLKQAQSDLKERRRKLGDIDQFSVKELKEINSIITTDDFLKHFGLEYQSLQAKDPQPRTIFGVEPKSGTFEEGGLQGIPVEEASHASCHPQMAVIEVPTKHPGTLHFPQCIYLERCGGCCFGSKLSCQPTESASVRIQIVEVGPEGAFPIVIEEQRHMKCSCQCILKEKDCNTNLHSYNSAECSCSCKNRCQPSLPQSGTTMLDVTPREVWAPKSGIYKTTKKKVERKQSLLDAFWL